MDLKVGDRVKAVIDIDYTIPKGTKGVIVSIYDKSPPIGVDWKINLSGLHDLNGILKTDTGYYVYDKYLKLSVVKNTELARFMYPNAKITECGGWLEI
jgi:hypothetical protein